MFLRKFLRILCLSLFAHIVYAQAMMYGVTNRVSQFLKCPVHANELPFFKDKQGAQPRIGSLVLIKQDQALLWGVLRAKESDGLYTVSCLNTSEQFKQVPLSRLVVVSPLWNKLFNPCVSLDAMKQLLDERNTYYRIHGAPQGRGMIIPAHSKVIIVGDVRGDYESLQKHIMRMYKEGLIDDQLQLKTHCYLVGLGNYIGKGQQSIAVFNFLLSLQAKNPTRVFLLAGDHERSVMLKNNELKDEWTRMYCQTQKTLCVSEIVWLKMKTLCASLPKVLLAGLQMPSTHCYDFVMFCHGVSDVRWRPHDMINALIEKHSNTGYAYPCEITDIQPEHCSESSFVTGTFVQDDQLEVARAKKAAQHDTEFIWTEQAFKQFVQQYVTYTGKNKMYRMCALLRGHDGIYSGLALLKQKGHRLWKPLKENKQYEVEPCSIFTCISGSAMTNGMWNEGALGILEAGNNGHWYLSVS